MNSDTPAPIHICSPTLGDEFHNRQEPSKTQMCDMHLQAN